MMVGGWWAGLTPRPPLHHVERGSSAWTGGDAWPWIAAEAAMMGAGKRYGAAQMNTYPGQRPLSYQGRGRTALYAVDEWR